MIYNYGAWTEGWCDGGQSFGTLHGPVLVNKCAMQRVAETYPDRFAAGPVKSRDNTDALCLYSKWMFHEWVSKSFTTKNPSTDSHRPAFWKECHTNQGCDI